ncbi:MAG: CPBP family intramembrane metalloprotease [Anaerolineales bacterium]|nr:CPBP family intramembrane metalloprotease [Anaerolineales bacterium]
MTTSVIATNKMDSKSLVEKYPLPIFFLLVYGLTWPLMIVEVLASRSLLPFQPPMAILILQAFMPGLAAVIVAGLTAGRAGIRALLGKLLIARVGFRWYAFAIFGLAAVLLAAILLGNQFGVLPALPILSTKMPPFSGPIGLLINVALLFIFSIIFNTEELAWRGFALPRLQSKYNALTSSLILSIPWILFHLPLFFKLGSSQAESSFISYAIGLAGMTVLFTWMFNNTRGSVLLAYLLHASMNTWTQIFSIDGANQTQSWMLTGLFVILAVIAVAISGAENLSRTNPRIQE